MAGVTYLSLVGTPAEVRHHFSQRDNKINRLQLPV